MRIVVLKFPDLETGERIKFEIRGPWMNEYIVLLLAWPARTEALAR